MLKQRYTSVYIMLMTLVVVSSNLLVQFPLSGTLFGINLADILTWGAFTYPFAFLITDLTNRQFGPANARIVVLCGFVTGVLFSALGGLFSDSLAASPQIAFASGAAFLVGQLLDISVFNMLRRQAWWQAPLAGSMLGSMLDTMIFFTLAFAPVFAVFAAVDAFVVEPAPILGVFALEAPRWISWALGDLAVKMLAALVLLLPYGAVMSVLKPMPVAGT